MESYQGSWEDLILRKLIWFSCYMVFYIAINRIVVRIIFEENQSRKKILQSNFNIKINSPGTELWVKPNRHNSSFERTFLMNYKITWVRKKKKIRNLKKKLEKKNLKKSKKKFEIFKKY